MGGPASYTDQQLGQLHRHLSISDADFDEVCKLLAETLDEFGFESADRDAVMQEFEARRSTVVTA